MKKLLFALFLILGGAGMCFGQDKMTDEEFASQYAVADDLGKMNLFVEYLNQSLEEGGPITAVWVDDENKCVVMAMPMDTESLSAMKEFPEVAKLSIKKEMFDDPDADLNDFLRLVGNNGYGYDIFLMDKADENNNMIIEFEASELQAL
ncbi:MAG: hypothetical protein J6X81_03080 [Muribaculaceae bacterium]|nr:hypothetical protein [Muribaculaceae bacterium]